MNLTLGILTDLHFGPAATFDGKLRKLTHHAAALTRECSVPRLSRHGRSRQSGVLSAMSVAQAA